MRTCEIAFYILKNWDFFRQTLFWIYNCISYTVLLNKPIFGSNVDPYASHVYRDDFE